MQLVRAAFGSGREEDDGRRRRRRALGIHLAHVTLVFVLVLVHRLLTHVCPTY